MLLNIKVELTFILKQKIICAQLDVLGLYQMLLGYIIT